MVLIGLLGVALAGFFFLAMAGISTPVSWLYAVVVFGAALAGPVMLLAGGALFSLNLKAQVAAKVALAGAIIVTLWAAGLIGSAVAHAAHPSANPAIDSAIHLRDAVVYALLAVAAGMADWAGFRASRLAR
jgi:hypothetical protein